jgi:hypothetical protein
MTITFSDWAAYPWKNELKLQADRVVLHLVETLDDEFQGETSPLDMLERAIALAGFAIRRLIEKRLVTDRFAAATMAVRSYLAVPADFRPPFLGRSGGRTYDNYDFRQPAILKMKPGDLANEIIHSSQLMVIGKDPNVSDGLLLASDWHQAKRVLHLTAIEFAAYVQAVLDDEVAVKSDTLDPVAGTVQAFRI